MTYTFTPSPTSNPESVKQLELDLAGIKPTPKRKRRIPRPLENHGLSNLCLSKDLPYNGSDPYVVRIYYKSMGGEVLCCDSDQMGYRKAERLYNEHRKEGQRYGWSGYQSDAIGALLLPIKDGKPVRPVKPGMRDARHVTFPSQILTPVEIYYEEQKAA